MALGNLTGNVTMATTKVKLSSIDWVGGHTHLSAGSSTADIQMTGAPVFCAGWGEQDRQMSCPCGHSGTEKKFLRLSQQIYLYKKDSSGQPEFLGFMFMCPQCGVTQVPKDVRVRLILEAGAAS